MMPVPLSYYSPLIGGLPGAAAIGMEPTFYWDSPAAGDPRMVELSHVPPIRRSCLPAIPRHSFISGKHID